jgi:O-methyltransferase involved in polyketide biosynthesis
MPGLTGWEPPPTLQWVEVDLPEIISYKREVLANEQPKCRLERLSLELSDGPARRKLVSDLDGRATRIVVASEGLLIYFTPEEVASLARDLASTRGGCGLQIWARRRRQILHTAWLGSE